MRYIKKDWQMPSDYQLLLHLIDIQHWHKLPRTIAEMEIKYYGFSYFVYGEKKIMVVK